MEISKTIYADENRYLPADSYEVKCGDKTARFSADCDKTQIGAWIKEQWEGEFFPAPAYVYMRIPNGVFDYDDTIVRLCKYEKIG